MNLEGLASLGNVIRESSNQLENLVERLKTDRTFKKQFMKQYGLQNDETVKQWTDIIALGLEFNSDTSFTELKNSMTKNRTKLTKAFTYSQVLNAIPNVLNQSETKDTTYTDYVMEETAPYETNKEKQLGNIQRPYFLHLAFKINVIIIVTDQDVNQPNVSEEESKSWKEKLKPYLLFVMQCLMAWAFLSVPLDETNLYKTFEPIIEKIDQIEINDDDPDSPDIENDDAQLIAINEGIYTTKH